MPFWQFTALLGVLACLYLVSSLPAATWIRLVVWMAIGLVVYFGYAYGHSRYQRRRWRHRPSRPLFPWLRARPTATPSIHDALPLDLMAALDSGPAAVLIAPPGAGKTTRVVPLALLERPWLAAGSCSCWSRGGSPRAPRPSGWRTTLGEHVGETVGYRVRMQIQGLGRATRIEVVTEGVFTRMILDDPALDGVAAVLFDEFHERSLDADLGLALARDSAGVLRDDLRLLVDVGHPRRRARRAPARTTPR